MLYEQGARVAVFDRDVEGARVVAAAVDGIAFEVDVRDADAVSAAVNDAATQLGGLRILVNNAGVGDLRPLHTVDDRLWHRLIDVNLTGTYNGMRSAIPLMVAGDAGVVVNVASLSGLSPTRNEAPYSAAKAGVIALTKSGTLEYGPSVRVNCVAPGFVGTPLTAIWDDHPDAFAPIRDAIPLQRIGDTRRDSGAGRVLVLRPFELHHRPDDRDRRRAVAPASRHRCRAGEVVPGATARHVRLRFRGSGEMGKVTCFATRHGLHGPEMCVFEHPRAGVQFPAGTLLDGEEALVRHGARVVRGDRARRRPMPWRDRAGARWCAAPRALRRRRAGTRRVVGHDARRRWVVLALLLAPARSHGRSAASTAATVVRRGRGRVAQGRPSDSRYTEPFLRWPVPTSTIEMFWAPPWSASHTFMSWVEHTDTSVERAEAIAFTATGEIVAVSEGEPARWMFPGGRREVGESLDDTLDRELLEEACALVTSREVLGYQRFDHCDGRRAGQVSLDAIYWARVDLRPFEARYRRANVGSCRWRRPASCPSGQTRSRSTCSPRGRRQREAHGMLAWATGRVTIGR